MAGLLRLSDGEAARIVERLEGHMGTSVGLSDDLHALGEAGRAEARGLVEKYLNDRDPELRSMALSVLIFHWHLSDQWNTCIRMSQDDPDSDVRRSAVAGLGSLRTGTKEPETLRVLLKIFRAQREDHFVRMMSYASILQVLGYHRTDGLSLRPLELSDIRQERVAEAEEVAEPREPEAR